MSTYVLPQVRVFQEASLQPTADSNPQRACLVGGNAHLVRISQSDEKALGQLGLYDEIADVDYVWPNKPATSVIDPSYTKLYAENALLRYFTDSTSSGSNIFLVEGTTNKIRAETLNFATNKGYARSAAFYSRDVQAGDIVRVRGTPTGPDADGPVTLWTYVQAVEPDVDGAVFGTPTAYSSNAPTSSLATTSEQTAGLDNWIIATPNGSAYDGTAAGHTNETYVIRVLDSSVGGDFTTARLLVLSASGTDDVLSVTPAASGDPTPIGTRGLVVTFDSLAESASWSDTENSAVDLVAGQEFTVTVTQAFTARAMQMGSGATYNGAKDTTYIIEVVKGGAIADGPQVMVTTSNGTDQSGPHTITADNTNIAIGTQGVVIKFATIVLTPSRHCKGDKFYVTVAAASSGPMKTLVLGKSLPATFQADDDLGIELYIRKPLLAITERNPNSQYDSHWAQSSSGITVHAGIEAYDDSLHDNGTPVALPLYSNSDLGYGMLYVEYRSWLQDLTSSLTVLYDVSELDVIPGKDTYDNPLKFNTRLALANSNGTGVLVCAVGNPASLDSWQDATELTTSRDDAYGLVPLTDDNEVLSLFQAHVDAVSSPSTGLWRSCWVPLLPVTTVPVVHAGSTLRGYTTPSTADGELALGYFEATSNDSDIPRTRLRVPAANANFITNGVRAGDIVRTFYGSDGFGHEVYSEYVVDNVESESVLNVVAGPTDGDDIPVKLEVWRSLTRNEQAIEIGRAAATYGDNRVCAVWAEALDPAYTITACAALAGLASGVLPQQGLTHVALSGLSPYVRATGYFSTAQLNEIAVRGGWIVDRPISGEIRTRHAVTTGQYADLNEREEAVRRNLDNISYRIKDFFSPYIGVTNVTPTMKAQIENDFTALAAVLQTERVSPTTGPQIIRLTLTRFETSEAFRDRYIVQVSVELPYPLNNLDIYILF